MKIPVSKPSLKGDELKNLTDCIESGWISSQGPFIKQFENNFADKFNTQYGVACSSGTTALTLALRALNIGPGDEVIVPEFTMIATAWAVSYTGAKPVFVDCDDTLNIDISKIEEKITSKTKAIVPVHIYGRICNMDAVMDIAREYNLRVVEDACETGGVKPRGDIACFSLFANKIITSGEGGISITDNIFLAEQMEHLRGMAFNKDHTFLHKKVGYNFRMSNLQAAVAVAQLRRRDEMMEKRDMIQEWYNRELNPQVLMPRRDAVWMYDIKLQSEHQRDVVQKHLISNSIDSRVFFKPMSMQPMYANEYKSLRAYYWSKVGLYLPTFVDITKEEVQVISDVVNKAYESSNRSIHWEADDNFADARRMEGMV